MFVRAFIGCLLVMLALPVMAGRNVWTATGPQWPEVAALLLPPSDPGFIYALTPDGTLYRSVTGAELSWVAISRLPAQNRSFLLVRSDGRSLLAADPANGNVLHAAIPSNDGIRLFRSGDHGVSWSESRLPHHIHGPLRSLAFDREQRGYLGGTFGIYVSRDGGRDWSSGRFFRRTNSILLGTDGAVYAATDGGLFVSSDHGENWTMSQPLAATSLARTAAGDVMFALTTSRRDIVYSRDGFETLQTLPPLPGDGTTLVVSDSGDRVYVGAASGVYFCDISVVPHRWSSVGELPVHGLVVEPGSSERLFAATAKGVFAIGSRGEDWRRASSGIESSAPVRNVAIAGNGDIYVTGAAGLSKSSDGGRSWRDVEGSTDARWVVTGGDTTCVAEPSGIYSSTDDGDTWTRRSTQGAAWLGMSPASPATLYAISNPVIRRSRDGGATWKDVTPESYWAPHMSYAAVEPSDPERVYIGYQDGLARSNQGGDSWYMVTEDPISALAVSGPVLLAVIHPKLTGPVSGIVSSLDGGRSWSDLRLAGEHVAALPIDPLRPWRSYAGTVSGIVYRSEDFGNEWTPLGPGYPGASVQHLAVSSDGDRIYAATAAGLYVYDHALPVDLERLADDPERLPRLMAQLRSRPSGTAGLLIPIAGQVRGAGGRMFRTDVTLANNRGAEQQVLILWLPQGNSAGADVPAFRLELPAATADDDGSVLLEDLREDLGFPGTGSMLVVAVDGAGNLDDAAEIDAFARIRSLSDCGGWVSQSLPAIAPDSFVTGQRARVIGLRHEPAYRTNVGIVNLTPSARSFRIVVTGESAEEEFTVDVPPFSPLQTAIPNRNYGAVRITVVGAGGQDPWVSYGSSIDNTSGDAWAAVARELRTATGGLQHKKP
jgi:photosystem II stability/assembly factor-like uncharacterized protein